MSDFWDNVTEIGRITKNKREDVIVSLCERKNTEFIDIRINKQSSYNNNEIYVPTSKGLNIKKEVLKDFLEILNSI